MDHQQNRRRAMEPGGGSGQSHPPPQPCPRCNSNNTKFCYYNNYSLTQPRYFCKGCRRYWTHGGTLRNVPVGGGCRKSKRPKLATTSPGTSSGAGTSGSHLQTMSMPPPLPPPHHQVISMMDNNNIINNTSTTTSSNVVPMMMSHSFFGGGSPGLLSSLAAMQGVNNPLSFGSNLAMLQGFSLQNFGQQPHNQEGCIPSLYSTREVGSSSMTPSMQEWNLRMGPGPEPGPVGPVVTQASISDHDHNHNRNRNRNQNLQENNDNNNRGSTNEQWSNFMGTSGLDDP